MQNQWGQDVIKIDSIGNIRRDSDNVVRIYFMQDRNKDITHIIELSEHAVEMLEQEMLHSLLIKQHCGELFPKTR